jgi:hypothetical protein
MTRGVRWYLVGSFVLVSLAGCGRGFFQSAEREPWRAEAEIACLKSGAVKESADLVRINPISGPGVCGAEYPLKVAALGESNGSFGFADELRPPAGIGGDQPRWPVSQPQYAAPASSYPSSSYPASSFPEAAPRQPSYGGGSNGPISLTAPGVAPDEGEIELPPNGTAAEMSRPYGAPARRVDAYPQNERYSAPPSWSRESAAPQSQDFSPLPRLGPSQGSPVNAFGAVAVTPSATLACPIVSALDKWLADSVQPAAMRWFGARVVEIKQIAAYSCRGRNGDHSSKISEHAFGNALDIAAFTLGDGRRIVVERGWSGLPEEQGFLRDVQAAACRQFTTVLAPGSNAAHYNHIHIDLRKRSRRDVCSPHAVSGEQVAARAGGRLAARHPEEPAFTSSVSGTRSPKKPAMASDDDDD